MSHQHTQPDKPEITAYDDAANANELSMIWRQRQRERAEQALMVMLEGVEAESTARARAAWDLGSAFGDVARAAAELLQFMPTGSYYGVPLQNLRIALGAGYWSADGYHSPTRPTPMGWIVPPWAWEDTAKPLDTIDDKLEFHVARGSLP